jgi:hypothetical protein
METQLNNVMPHSKYKRRPRKVVYVKTFRFLYDGKSYDYIYIFLVNVFADAPSMAMLRGLGKIRLHVTKQKGRGNKRK